MAENELSRFYFAFNLHCTKTHCEFSMSSRMSTLIIYIILHVFDVEYLNKYNYYSMFRYSTVKYLKEILS